MEGQQTSRMTAGGIENVVEPDLVERKGYANLYEFCKKSARGSKRYFYLELENGKSHTEYPRELMDPVSNRPTLEEINQFLEAQGLYLAHTIIRTNTSLTTNLGGDLARYLGGADVYRLIEKELEEDVDEEVIMPDGFGDDGFFVKT